MKTFTLTLDENQLNQMVTAIVELPFKTAQPLIEELRSQIQKQNIEQEKTE